MNIDSIKPYFLTDEKEENLWNDAVIVFDSSALLDIYFVPKTTRMKIYTEIFEKLANRLWIPFQVQYEYFKNRKNCIEKPVSENYEPLRKKVENIDIIVEKKKKELLNSINGISNDSKNNDKHPYIEQTKINEFKKNIEDSLAQIEKCKDNFKKEVLTQIEDAKKEVLSVKDSDDVLEALEKSFKVGREYSYSEILEITKEGKHRYEFKIPPGYGDLKEKKGTQIFGDLIIWKQILEYSKKEKKHVIFITNDIKKDEDWCYLDKKVTEDRIHSPREELVKEIKDYSSVDFWMYNLPQFLYNANKYLNSTIKEDVIQNISQFLNTKDDRGKYLKFKCDKCGRIHKHHKSDFNLDFECVDSSERNMGPENQYSAEECFKCECGNHIRIIFNVWEYPIGAHNYDSIETEGAELLESFYFTVNFYGDSDDDFYTCNICTDSKDGYGNEVSFFDKLELKNEYPKMHSNHKYKHTFAGNCSRCGTLHIKCPKCGSITEILNENQNIECEGGCGLIFYKEIIYYHDGDGDFTLKLIDHRAVKK